MPHNQLNYHELLQEYSGFFEPQLQLPFLLPDKVFNLLLNYTELPGYRLETIGSSFLGSKLQLLSIGNGNTKIFLWSQMHGDEPTATASLFDLLNYLLQNYQNSRFIQALLQKCTISIIPMLNPDGATVFNRRNAQDIDLNRDVLQRNSPEIKALITTFERLRPDFCFNLHDQSTLYSAGISSNQVVFSFLAPPYDNKKSISHTRSKAIKLIASLSKMLQSFVPGHIARYNDDFEPRAIGDFFQSRGVPTILIECGGMQIDPNKEYIRKLHTFTLLHAFQGIVDNSFDNYTHEEYFSIPENGNRIYDLILRGVYLEHHKKVADIGINFNQVNNPSDRTYLQYGFIEEIADLTGYFGLSELDCSGFTAHSGRVISGSYPSKKGEMPISLIKQGYLGQNGKIYTILDEQIVSIPLLRPIIDSENRIERGNFASLTLWQNNLPMYAIINGKILNISRND